MLRSTGTSYPAINADDLGEIPFFLPSTHIQKKIGAILSLVNQKDIQVRRGATTFEIHKILTVAATLYINSCCNSAALAMIRAEFFLSFHSNPKSIE